MNRCDGKTKLTAKNMEDFKACCKKLQAEGKIHIKKEMTLMPLLNKLINGTHPKD